MRRRGSRLEIWAALDAASVLGGFDRGFRGKDLSGVGNRGVAVWVDGRCTNVRRVECGSLCVCTYVCMYVL